GANQTPPFPGDLTASSKRFPSIGARGLLLHCPAHRHGLECPTMNLQLGKRISIGLRSLALTALVLLFVGSLTAAKDATPPEFDSPAKVKPGATGLLKAAGKGMRYFLRVPRNYDPNKGARLIVFLH